MLRLVADQSLRSLVPVEKLLLQVRTNWVGLIDEWAGRFFHELDYEREAENGMTFKQQMVGLEGIVIADVYQQLTNKMVLTTAWVEGTTLCA